MNEKVGEEELKKLNSYFGDYEFKNPLLEIENSIEESTSFLRYILYAFSLLSIFSSLILSFVITFIKESKLFVILGKLIKLSSYF